VSVRLRLTLWYTALTALTMVLSSLILYVVLQQTLTTDADAFLRGKAVDLTASIQVIGGPTAYWVHLPDLDRFCLLYTSDAADE